VSCSKRSVSCSKFLKQRPPVPWKSETTILQLTKEYSKNEHKHLLRNDKKVTQKIRNVYIYAKKYYINLLAIVFHYKKVTLWIDRSVFAGDSKEGKTVAPSMKKFRRILWRKFIEFCEEVSSELFPGLLNFSETESSIFDCEIFGRAAFDVQYILFLNS